MRVGGAAAAALSDILQGPVYGDGMLLSDRGLDIYVPTMPRATILAK